MMDTKTGLTLKEWRSRKKYTQPELARKIGISPSTYNIWENNPDAIKPKDAFKIAKTLEVSIDEIIFLKDESYFKYVLVDDNRIN
ncbi:helix-turn-helix transcriptional regulator [Staphylococcus equorum]|uniref:Helix-turn-helix transcriptional regulator n=1 Tax=Staphylococcus equorum TaxID=246432 RepID=A0A9X4L635_9STAP|nr:helix-turn-helix transcriptional regulator [Staphylococcus equorum]MDG0820463.1 helix-turn-helix transcriptional regulator [Staphylococcus equorum]MDG0841748.1 helix-turn-helix transcriptional regulator [Staphylococcus equorum]MDG0846788.1 helix-turn-helix transcriptional regulator [Staphylococcus equorum]MDK9844900.1 helix-turn-helix transcriptional regulator [Staphylococcus equorum]MDK9853175.1 helix-turn-helix transcriptional regulator [Staphylococcus equorum]